MAQIKISELELNTQMSNEDVLAGVDTSEQKTKKFKLETLKNFINKEQDEQITKNKNDISANATNIETNAKDISNNSKNIEKNTQDIVENKKNITDNTNRVKRIEDTLYDSGEANGTSINIKDSTLAEFQEISVDGVCKQTTTTGKNLANDNDFKGEIIGGNKTIPNISVNENEVFSITLSQTLKEIGTNGNNNDYIAQHNLKWLDENENVISQNNFLMMTFNSVGETKTLSASNYVAPTGAKYLKLDVGSYFANGCKVIHNYIQVERGNVDTEYEPYTGGVASPSPSYPQPIEVIDEDFEVKSCGSNFYNFDVKQILDVTPNEDGTITLNGNGGNGLKFAPFKLLANKKYYQKIELVSGEVTGVSGHYGIMGVGTNSFMAQDYWYTFTPAEDVTVSSLWVHQAAVFNNAKFKIWIAKEKTEFEPYQETRVPINLPDGEFVGKLSENDKDQVRIAFNEEDGEYQNNLYKVLARDVLNGSEDGWEYVEQYNYFRCPSYVFSETPTGNMNERMCSHFKVIANWTEFRDDSSVNGIAITKDGYKICIRNTNCSTVEEFKQALSESPVTIIYKIAEPYEVNLGVVDMPLSYSPETNVFTTSELEAVINAKYYRNFINTIQNLQVNEKALQQELIDINSRLTALETNLVNLANEEVESEVVE